MARHIVIDAEADGPCPGLYSMVSLGITTVFEKERVTGKWDFRPISDLWNKSALDSCNLTREQTLLFKDPGIVMQDVRQYLDCIKEKTSGGRIVCWSDNPAFDWQFLNYYMWKFLSLNPIGFSCRRIGDLYSGAIRTFSDHTSWKNLRVTKHDHNPLHDAIGNAEALEEIVKRMKGDRPE